LVVWLFPLDIAMAAILILTFGDGVSTFVGKRFGKTKIIASGKKTWEGSLAGLVSAVGASTVFLSTPVALLASTVGMLAEAFEFRVGKWAVNDNIIVPLVAASTIWLMRFWFSPLV
jgi:dolichol kinase